jgi:hypothetical protein
MPYIYPSTAPQVIITPKAAVAIRKHSPWESLLEGPTLDAERRKKG